MSGNRSSSNSYLRFGQEDTFLTGGGLPGKRHYEEEDDEQLTLEKYLLNEVDQYEKDFKEMFAYLNEVEDMLHGDDVGTIQEMIDISDVRMKGHITQYDQMN